MAIGRLQAALAAATNEVTVAAANINFDFTLIKCEAPKEYQGLGNVLTRKRKENAEFGSTHVLARQLGALFDGICDPTPALLQAYGNRASEIAKASQKTSEPYIGTPFGEYTGADGTSIWAAATSSKCALHVHLLACILARVWTAQEAVAIWAELVSERKKEIARKVEEGEPVAFALAAAVGQDLSRPQLVAWDTSARAWLRTADQFSCRRQKQLELILKNLDLSVTGGPAVFPSVIKTWKIALVTMEKLVSGIPQAVDDGAALVGLSAWHLYPDMILYSPKFVEVKMEDANVVEGGVLSLGVSRGPNSSNRESGVHWSLSLAQLQHYGRPVQVTRNLEADSRLTWAQLTLVIFAAMLEQWGMETTQNDAFARLLTSLFQQAKPERKNDKQITRRFKIMSDGAFSYMNRNTGDRNLNYRLIQLGRRRSHQFFGTTDNIEKRFDLFNLNSLPGVSKDTESAILYLRHATRHFINEHTQPDDFLIRHSLSQKTKEKKIKTDVPETILPDAKLSDHILAHLPPWNPTGSKPNIPEVDDSFFDEILDITSESGIPGTQRSIFVQNASFVLMTAVTPSLEGGVNNPVHHRWLPADVPKISVPESETYTLDVFDKFQCAGKGDLTMISVIGDPEACLYRPVLGIPGMTALFTRGLAKNDIVDYTTILEDCQWCLDNDLIIPMRFLELLEHFICPPETEIWRTIDNLSIATLIYEDTADATIDTKILMKPLYNTNWAQSSNSKRPKSEIMLSMISYFETGVHDIEPTLLKNAIAVACTDSIFVPSALIQDPYESLRTPAFTPFRRILGNIGKPGLTFLLPPLEPMTREIDTGSWRLDSYQQFDGTKSQSFENTFMHLWFTNYHVPLYDGSQGAHDNQIFLLESVISVQDKGEWIADVDPLPLIYGTEPSRELVLGKRRATGRLRRVNDKLRCQHKMNSYSEQDITAVDTWNELLDMPAGAFVVRAGNNWVSRLASTLVACQRLRQNPSEFTVTICPPDVCWTCNTKQTRNHCFIF